MSQRRRRLTLYWPQGRRQCHFMRRRAKKALGSWLTNRMDQLAADTLAGRAL